jgi:hypothetical protein
VSSTPHSPDPLLKLPLPTHLLKLPSFVLVGPLEEVEQDDVTENSSLEERQDRLRRATWDGWEQGGRTQGTTELVRPWA